MAATPRLQKELNSLRQMNYTVALEQPNLWTLSISGPQTSPFEGGTFQIAIGLNNFPFSGPSITFRTMIYHPDISTTGLVSPPAIQTSPDQWTPTTSLVQVINSTLNLMLTPNVTGQNPNNPEALNNFNSGQWDTIARSWTLQYASNAAPAWYYSNFKLY